MLRSMTSYGNGEYTQGQVRFTAEIKSVNARYRDITLRTPRQLQPLEEGIKAAVGSRIRRGRIDVSIQMDGGDSGTDYDLELNRPLVGSYLRIHQQLTDEFGLQDGLRPRDLFSMKDVVVVKPVEMDIETLKPAILAALDKALQSFEGMRIREGTAIQEDFLGRLQTIEGYLGSVEEKAPLVVEGYRKRLEDRLRDLARERELDETRLLQEIALFADKCDITEEIVRARSHLGQFRHYLSLDEAVGRRLDFLTQELHREVNTMSTKASDAPISAMTVEIKGELEKLREQIQNIE